MCTLSWMILLEIVIFRWARSYIFFFLLYVSYYNINHKIHCFDSVWFQILYIFYSFIWRLTIPPFCRMFMRQIQIQKWRSRSTPGPLSRMKTWGWMTWKQKGTQRNRLKVREKWRLYVITCQSRYKTLFNSLLHLL